MITSRRFLPILALASSISSGKAAATLDRPKFEATARVKSHFHKNGQLVKGEEDLLKIIVKWDHIPGAKSYELCMHCNHIDEETGEVKEGKMMDGMPWHVDATAEFQCGGNPCFAIPAIQPGNNKFHLRAMMEDGPEQKFTPWSRYQNFDVQEPGNFGHTEL